MSDVGHIWHRCHACNVQPIIGNRFDCQSCPVGPDTALCERCYVAFTEGSVKHPRPQSFADAMESDERSPHEFRPFPGQSLANCSNWLTVRPALAAPFPAIADGSVVRPEFCLARQTFFGSYGFVVATKPLLVLTALHTMSALARVAGVAWGPDSPSYSGKELPALVTHVNLYDVFARNWMITDLGTAKPMVPLAHARVGDEEPFSFRDIAAFEVPRSSRLAPLALARDAPRVGDPLWLAVAGERSRMSRALAAVVVEITDRTLVFRYLNGTDPPLYTSGAPLVNAQSEVVGINVGGGWLDGAHLGHANHVLNIRRHLEGAHITV